MLERILGIAGPIIGYGLLALAVIAVVWFVAVLHVTKDE
jgi:hypothetical protein